MNGESMSTSSALHIEKAHELQEPIDLWFYSPLGHALVRVLKRTPATPNMVSAASVVAAGLGAWFYLDRSLRGATLGTAMVVLSALFDTADGQLARATGRGTALGRLIDGLCDNLAFVCLYISVMLTLAVRLELPLPLSIAICAATGAQQMLQCAMSDYARLLFVELGLGERSLDTEEPDAVQKRIDAAAARGASFLSLALMRQHHRYVRMQRRLLPSSGQLRVAMISSARPELRQRYATVNTRLLRAWSILSLNSYHQALAVAAFLPFVFPHSRLAQLGLALYLGFVWLLDVPLLLLVRAQRRSDERLLRELDG